MNMQTELTNKMSSMDLSSEEYEEEEIIRTACPIIGGLPILQAYRPTQRRQKTDNCNRGVLFFDAYLQYVEDQHNPGSKFGFLPMKLNKAVRLRTGFVIYTDVATIHWRSNTIQLELILPNGTVYNPGRYVPSGEHVMQVRSRISKKFSFYDDIGEKTNIPIVHLRVFRYNNIEKKSRKNPQKQNESEVE